MRLRWKREEKQPELAFIGAQPLGSKLWDGERGYAYTWPYPCGWSRYGRKWGWYWIARGENIPPKNTCKELCETEEEAKEQAKAYVLKYLKSK